MPKNKIVWALFDTENQCCFNSLSGENCKVHSFGLRTGKKSVGIDLDLSCFEAVKRELSKYPSPDYVFASPPCETWVIASACNKAKFTSEPGINLHWRNRWNPFDFTNRFREKRINGVNTALFVCELLKYFKPEFWAVENGNRSLIFDYMFEFGNLTGYKNKCNYYSYGFNIIKRTVVYSNCLLFLKNILPTVRFPQVSYLPSYKKRSLVPAGLYRDIFTQFAIGGNKTLFDNFLK